jgi:hypothetical protein
VCWSIIKHSCWNCWLFISRPVPAQFRPDGAYLYWVLPLLFTPQLAWSVTGFTRILFTRSYNTSLVRLQAFDTT